MSNTAENFISLFDAARQAHKDEECYGSYDVNLTRQSISFQDLWVLASRFANNLKEAGLKKGDVVVVATPLSIEYIVASFGVIFAGGNHVSMEKFFPKCEMLKETIKMTHAKFLLLTDSAENETWPFFEPKSKVSAKNPHVASYSNDNLPSLGTIIFTNKGKDKDDAMGFLNYLRGRTAEFRNKDIHPEEACMCSSSLNPGVATPKVVQLSHRAVVNTARLYHTYFSNYTKCHMRWPWYIGATAPFDALTGKPRLITDTYARVNQNYSEHNLDVIKTEGLKMAMMGPPDIKGLADANKNHSSNGEKLLEHIMSGGQPITKAIFEVAQQVSKNVHIVYFASEANFVTCNNLGPDEEFTPFDSGRPVEGVEIKILGDNNQELPQGKTGRITIRSPYLFTCYSGQPELTNSVWGEDGWFHTNDAGCFSSDGHLHVYGRMGDVISRGIVLTYPSWIEKPIWRISDVIEVMAVPVPDPINYQNICACVVLRPGSALTEKDVMRKYEQTVTEDGNDFFHLDHVLLFDTALPKLARNKLGEVAAERLGIRASSN